MARAQDSDLIGQSLILQSLPPAVGRRCGAGQEREKAGRNPSGHRHSLSSELPEAGGTIGRKRVLGSLSSSGS